MQEPGKEWKNTLFRAAPQVDSWIIEHVGYFSVEIFIGIQALISIERNIRIDLLHIELKVSTIEQIFSFVYDYMPRRIDIKEDVYEW